LLDEWSAAFQFGPHFGENWDALLDCLSDRHAQPDGALAIVLDAKHVLEKEPAKELATLVGVLTEAIKRWRHSEAVPTAPFCVALQGGPSEQASIRSHWESAGANIESLE
jgi:hypothetical protein